MNNTLELKNLFSSVKFLAFDFDGVFTDNIVYTTDTGQESVACWRSDGIGLSNVKKLGIPIWVISTETNPVVTKRCEKLGIDCMQGCDDKLSVLCNLIDQHRCELKHSIFVGNDINDAACLEKVGLPIVVADSHPDIQHFACYQTEKPGGKGAVREICDLIVKYRIG